MNTLSLFERLPLSLRSAQICGCNSPRINITQTSFRMEWVCRHTPIWVELTYNEDLYTMLIKSNAPDVSILVRTIHDIDRIGDQIEYISEYLTTKPKPIYPPRELTENDLLNGWCE